MAPNDDDPTRLLASDERAVMLALQPMDKAHNLAVLAERLGSQGTTAEYRAIADAVDHLERLGLIATADREGWYSERWGLTITGLQWLRDRDVGAMQDGLVGHRMGGRTPVVADDSGTITQGGL